MNARVRISTIVAAGFAAILAAQTPAHAEQITGAGSTFVYPVLAKWADAYNKKTGVAVNYQSIGSGGGIKQIGAGTVTFGATDMPLTPAQLAKQGLMQFPVINGADVPVINVPGIKAGEITLDGPTLAKMFMGTVKTWDDPAIKKLNPGVKLPTTAIAIVHRSDASGTTFVFTNYLAKVSPEWKSEIGSSTAVAWPVGIGAKGNEGVAGSVGQTGGSLGYVEYAYAKQNKMTYVKMVNDAGKTVSPEAASFRAAAASADWAKAQDFYVIMTNAPGKDAWPVAGSTFILMHKNPENLAATEAALKFFAWGYENGQQMAADLDYVPMPASAVKLIEASWAKNIKGHKGVDG